MISWFFSISGGQNSNLRSWTLTWAQGKNSSSWISLRPSSTNNLCLNLDTPVWVAKSCFTAFAGFSWKSSGSSQHITWCHEAHFHCSNNRKTLPGNRTMELQVEATTWKSLTQQCHFCWLSAIGLLWQTLHKQLIYYRNMYCILTYRIYTISYDGIHIELLCLVV